MAFSVLNNPINHTDEYVPFSMGVSFCGNTTPEAKLLIDKVKTYTNLFVLQSGPISKNETAINEICDYAVASGLNIIVYFGWFDTDCPWQIPWLDYARTRWSDKFLGIYYYDEPGGIQIDTDWPRFFSRIKLRNSTLYQAMTSVVDDYLDGTLPRDYDGAANRYIDAIRNDRGLKELKNRSITTFTSDYGLYWFDYLGGYDVVLAQLGWNSSIAQDIALVRGSARMQNKSWGAIITWKYQHAPYLDNGDEIYQQMLMAYEAGAEYIMIFNYPYNNSSPYGIMLDEHFKALERFWNDVTVTPKIIQGSARAETVLVLPRNYGWGMRHPDDRIWFWGPDEKSLQIWTISRKLVSHYGHYFDIVYDDSEFQIKKQYAQIFYWNASVNLSSE
ncbi:MAG: hypothetical protein ACYSR0_09825 [Planctomycetota bacterium]